MKVLKSQKTLLNFLKKDLYKTYLGEIDIESVGSDF